MIKGGWRHAADSTTRNPSLEFPTYGPRACPYCDSARLQLLSTFNTPWFFSFPICFFSFIRLGGRRLEAGRSGPRTWQFPRDHGAHPEYRTEWWYFTGNLADGAGARFGYQLTFFRQGLRFKLPDKANPWDVRDVYLGHLAITDVAGNKFHHADKISRSGPGLAKAARDNLDIRLLNWWAKMKGPEIFLQAKGKRPGAEPDLDPQETSGLSRPKRAQSKRPEPGPGFLLHLLHPSGNRGHLKNAESTFAGRGQRPRVGSTRNSGRTS